MTEDVKARAFEPFFTTKEADTATGLGLSTCYGIVTQSGGHILIDSEPGAGTDVIIYLPRAEAGKSGQTAGEESAELPRGTETVLLVEDDPAVRDAAARLLRQQGYTVIEAADGAEALRLAEARGNEEIHLLLADVVMPFMGSQELSERLRAIRFETKVLLTSGYTHEASLRSDAVKTGAGFIPKPFTADGLARKVREVLDGRWPRAGD